MKKYLSILLLFFISCKEKSHWGKFVVNDHIALDSFWMRVTGYDTIQILSNYEGDKLTYNFCYPNKWQYVKFRKDTLFANPYNKSKCKIKKIGKVYKENGGTVVAGWSFDCSGFKNDYIGGTVPYENLVGGWTITELKYIAQFQDTGLFTPDYNFAIETWYDTVPVGKNKKSSHKKRLTEGEGHPLPSKVKANPDEGHFIYTPLDTFPHPKVVLYGIAGIIKEDSSKIFYKRYLFYKNRGDSVRAKRYKLLLEKCKK